MHKRVQRSWIPNLYLHNSRPLAPDDFKLPSLVAFYGKSNLLEHVTAINTQMEMIGVEDSFKCKFMDRKLKETTLHSYMNLPRFSLANYQDLFRKLIHQFQQACNEKYLPPFFSNMCEDIQNHYENT